MTNGGPWIGSGGARKDRASKGALALDLIHDDGEYPSLSAPTTTADTGLGSVSLSSSILQARRRTVGRRELLVWSTDGRVLDCAQV